MTETSPDGLKQKAVLPIEDVQAGDEMYYTWTGNRWLIGDVMTDQESGFTYIALLDSHTKEFEQIDHIKPECEVTVYTNRSLQADTDQ